MNYRYYMVLKNGPEIIIKSYVTSKKLDNEMVKLRKIVKNSEFGKFGIVNYLMLEYEEHEEDENAVEMVVSND